MNYFAVEKNYNLNETSKVIGVCGPDCGDYNTCLTAPRREGIVCHGKIVYKQQNEEIDEK